MAFPVVMYGCESWTIKKAECQRIDAFELMCRRRLLRDPWTANRSNHSILKEICPECSLKTDVEAETPILWPPSASLNGYSILSHFSQASRGSSTYLTLHLPYRAGVPNPCTTNWLRLCGLLGTRPHSR
jgi:hypothetical protein